MKFKTEIKWGILFSIISILWLLLLVTLGYTSEKIEQFPTVDSLFFIIAILIYVMAFRDKRQKNGNKLSWKQAFVSGILIGIVVMILSIPSQAFIHKIIIPDFFKNNIEYAVAHKKMTLEAAQKYFNLKSYMIQSVIFAPVAGAITGAIVGLLMKRK
ncbi:Protein of unknown function [Pustulibacterium marinum]|uniref:DUF4199 domain-containing protein n=1 Tax=Pustulibacterium marinum TaxID=1224947 RepID=A0A1I7HMC7_9FLAO|nr:DUF4199 domain-containing protein [Pustulibacterium marinum]SFU61719.1 Protein of unknown function [Pustulibacterium marinum]